MRLNCFAGNRDKHESHRDLSSSSAIVISSVKTEAMSVPSSPFGHIEHLQEPPVIGRNPLRGSKCNFCVCFTFIVSFQIFAMLLIKNFIFGAIHKRNFCVYINIVT